MAFDPRLRSGIFETARALGMSPVDLATIISYETAGTFDPTKRGPTTKWGQHRGLIQFGEPQARQHGVDWQDPIGSQLGPDGAVAKYFKASGFKPGMGLLDAYSTVNAGAPGLYNRSDAAAGGAPGTVRDKVENQMAGHRAKAEALIGSDPYAMMADGPKGEESYPPVFGSMAPGGGSGSDTLAGGAGGVFAGMNPDEANAIGGLLGGDNRDKAWGHFAKAGAYLDSMVPEAPRISGGGGDARQTGNALLEALSGGTVADSLLKKRLGFLR